MPNTGASKLSLLKEYAAYSISTVGFVLLPLSLFWGEKTLPLFYLILILSFGRFIIPPFNIKQLPKAHWPIALFLMWALASCFWSGTNYSIQSWAVFLLCLAGLYCFYDFLLNDKQDGFHSWFRLGFFFCTGLLILDEILNTAILRTLCGPTTDTPAYFQGITLIVTSIWLVLGGMNDSHPSRKILTIIALGLAVFYSTDFLSKIALMIGLTAFGITYICPKWSTRTITILSTAILLTSPQIVQQIDPHAVIAKFKNVKQAYPILDRIFVLKYTSQAIENKPIFGHGFNHFGSTIDLPINPTIADNIVQLFQIIELAEKGLSRTSYSINMQVWYDLGFIGALLLASILAITLWPLSNIENRRFQISTFMGFYTTAYLYANTAFDSHTPWWLVSNGIIAMLALQRIKT